MEPSNSKQHWENIYQTKAPEQVSWTQQVPKTSLALIESFALAKTASIIDIGGGDSNLVDYLLEAGYQDITVLDISQNAIDRAKERLGKRASDVKWIVSDIMDFNPDSTYDVWHDRATFHFLTGAKQISPYIQTVRRSVKKHVIIGTFSKKGPTKCSGLEIKQYDKKTLAALLQEDFETLGCITEDHITPFNTAQNFVFCSFKRKGNTN